jgi:NAD(P)-dependent dehydrogenase (short-subunit alcohol dehydrogenase family)
MANSELSNQGVIVIGGSSGIGYAVARRCLEEGARVVIGSSDQRKVDAAVARLGGDVSGSVVDVRDEDSVRSFFERTGRFDHLACTAGDWDTIRVNNPIATLDLEVARSVFGVRFWGALVAVKHALPFISERGSITFTNGMVAHRPRKGAALNTAMAGAIEHLTRSLAVDLAPRRINAVCPGIVLTEVWDGVPEDQRDARIQGMTGRQPLARAADPLEVAEAYLYSMRATYTTGQVLLVDGGMSLV